MPNLAVIEELKKKKRNVEILYIGSTDGIEKKMIMNGGITYRGVLCGKLRRYFSLKNLVDGFKVPVGVLQAMRILRKFKPSVVFSKGGFVSVPVVVAARLLKIPVIVHESDLVPGLANKLLFKFADKICLSFEESKKHLRKYMAKVEVTGNPVRKEILEGDKEVGYKFTGLDKHRPVILVMGGSQGARQINKLVRDGIDELLKRFQIVHIRGRGNLDIGLHRKGYAQYEYLNEQLKDVYAMSEMIVSRAGANSLFEIAYLKKKAVIIPLGESASRGEQVTNARIFASRFGWTVLTGEVSADNFIKSVEMTYQNKFNGKIDLKNVVEKVVGVILKYK